MCSGLSACGVKEAQLKTDTPTKQTEQAFKKIVDYGEKVNVKGKKMNVYTTGTGEKTIVLLPGLGEFTQVYSHHNLIEEYYGSISGLWKNGFFELFNAKYDYNIYCHATRKRFYNGKTVSLFTT